MKPTFATASLAALLLATAAFAQTQPVPASPPPAPGVVMPAPTTTVPPAAMPAPRVDPAPTGTVTAPARPAATAAMPGMLGTQLWKQAVYDPKEARIGEIDDIVVDANGQITEVVIGVGGFLGIGEKAVAVPYASLKPMARDGRIWFELGQTKEQLTAAPAFDMSRFKRS